jgi:hypothetical protein
MYVAVGVGVYAFLDSHYMIDFMPKLGVSVFWPVVIGYDIAIVSDILDAIREALIG